VTSFIPSAVGQIFVEVSREPISSANPQFKIKNPRVSASRERGKKLQHSRRPGTAFTLVELLAVVGIMGLLAAVAVPALKGLTGSGGRKQALSQVMGALEIARNTAISSGTNAAVIFPDSSFTFIGSTEDSRKPYKYRSMAVVAWNATNAPATMVGSWIVLPQGIALFPNSISALPQTNNISFRILTLTISNPAATFRAISFQSDGALDETLTPFPTNGIAFFEGTVTGTTTNPTSKMNKFETIRLTRYTGRTIPTLAPAPTNAP
jgi:type II secretory pathway pseudopilin PulG